MLKIEVVGSYVKNVTGTKGDNAGKQFHIPMVEAYAHLPGEKYPVKCDFPVEKGKEAPKAGAYLLGPGSFYVDGYGQLGLRRTPELVSMSAAAARAAA